MANADLFASDRIARPLPLGFNAIGLFLFFGALMAAVAATTLLWPGTALDRAWVLNRSAYAELVPRGPVIGVLFLLLSLALACSGIGWLRRQVWGWRLTVVIISIQVLGDGVNCVRGNCLRGGSGLIIAGALLFYLLRRKIRSAFVSSVQQSLN